jgi:hypothetical protein
VGKFDAIIGNLPELPVEDLAYQEKIDKIKEEIKSEQIQTPASLADGYAAARFGTVDLSLLDEDFKKQMIEMLGVNGLDALQKEAQKKLTAYEQLVAESWDADDPGWGMYGATPNMLRLQSGASISVQPEPKCKVEDKEAFRKWCIANGLENSLQLWPSTMESLSKERLLNGLAVPDGIRAFVRNKIVWRKEKS